MEIFGDYSEDTLHARRKEEYESLSPATFDHPNFLKTAPIDRKELVMKRLAQLLVLILCLQVSAPFAEIAAQKPAKSKAQFSSTTNSPGRYAAQIKIFDEFVRQQMALDKTPGLTIGFWKDGFVWVKGYGFSDLENRVNASPETAYRLASVSKSMTAVAIMQLVEKGKIDLDAEVQTYVPYFPKKQWPITTRQLLGHLGGISHYKNAAQELHIKEKKTTREAIAIFESFDLIAEPGTRYSYTSYGYNLLGAIVEAASGMSFGDYLRQNVWQPSGMNDTRLDDPLELIPNRARGYQLINGQVKNSEFVDISSRFAAGGTRSTIPDLLKYAATISAGKLLTDSSMAQMSTSMSTREGRLTNYGMGWDTGPQSGRYMLAHSGGQQETVTLLYVVPKQKLAFAIGMNFEAGNPGVYLDRLFQLITGAPRNLGMYAANKSNTSLVDAMNTTFNYGLASYEQRGSSLAKNPQELTDAFAYFNANVNGEVLTANAAEAAKKIREGVHPAGNQAFTKVGSFMAEQLAKKRGAAQLLSYPEQGSPAFFNDYVTLTKADASLPAFNESFVKSISPIANDWSAANSAYVRTLWLMPDSDLNQIGTTLRKTFANKSVYPNLAEPLVGLTRLAVLNRNYPRAMESGKLALDLYPENAGANFAYGIGLLLSGDAAQAQTLLKKSAALNPNGTASAGGMNGVAYLLGDSGMLDEAIKILNTAIALYPQEANLHDSLGEMQLRKGNKAAALGAYKKALELNPNFPNANAAKEIVKKLSEEVVEQRN